ncbi:methionine adenosyltransferase [Campylobacter fetus]|uniref:Methionine adenosyltransferase n=1 Tax=Campylobacter fetus subsp. testudinum TaxID=1507806 RepID=A0AAX0HBZ7_CAMFE|nr:methionine adenosyltransferase [Campylobacter fetus]AGZ81579.1 methionine adenosyltransferase [Campylobacter fetus subsp. testudinum 03-427]AJB45320.1 S-adenosylmethionine synthetase [Campylobacter fetus subsp. testudinum]AVK80987.1 methionine adenosyltransferase [Campylobacter fetus subsp. testudinum]EAI4321444.1 methionine adenosyltransferase [Campylobacter fetus]EAI4390700.1 methionine adenosyltransferase [Campylobacter fetus]
MYLFTSEVVSPGHPDKCADIIADSIVDAILKQDPNGRVASEVFVAGKHIIIGGEVNANVDFTHQDYRNIVKNTLKDIGYNGNPHFTRSQCLHPDDLEVDVFLNQQSPDINQGVDQSSGEIGAGDQGIMFGFASSETENFMPSAITYARMLCDKVYDYALKNPDKLGVDIKTQVTIDYGSKSNFENCKPESIHTIVVSAPSVENLQIEEVRTLIQGLIDDAGLPKELYNKEKTIIYINPTGRYVNHSSLHDSGLTGRKLIVDSFGGYSPIGGGAQSSKDYTKVDRSGLYAARWIAKNIVAAGLAKKCIVQLSYAIGVAKPVSISVDCMGTNSGVDDERLSEFVHESFALTPRWITEKFGLDKPSADTFLYAKVAAGGQVGVASYPWEKLDAVEIFKKLK